jgi:hypothetical protein
MKNLYYDFLNQKYACRWRLKVKIHTSFYGDYSLVVIFRKLKYGTEKIMDIAYLQVLFESLFYFEKLSNMVIVWNLDFMLEPTLNRYAQNSVMSCLVK